MTSTCSRVASQPDFLFATRCTRSLGNEQTDRGEMGIQQLATEGVGRGWLAVAGRYPGAWELGETN